MQIWFELFNLQLLYFSPKVEQHVDCVYRKGPAYLKCYISETTTVTFSIFFK